MYFKQNEPKSTENYGKTGTTRVIFFQENDSGYSFEDDVNMLLLNILKSKLMIKPTNFKLKLERLTAVIFKLNLEQLCGVIFVCK